MSDKKIIIRNCPAYDEGDCASPIEHTPYATACQHIEDCKLKQIVELCKNKNYFVKRFPDAQFSSGVQNSELAFDILQLLDIQEVE